MPGTETQTENRHVDMVGGGEGGMNWEIRFDINTSTICKILGLT